MPYSIDILFNTNNLGGEGRGGEGRGGDGGAFQVEQGAQFWASSHLWGLAYPSQKQTCKDYLMIVWHERV
jgi:hypothetical protein